jgi:hypothetical protein
MTTGTKQLTAFCFLAGLTLLALALPFLVVLQHVMRGY